MDYTFNCEIAAIYGVDGAIFIQNLNFWLMKNEANGRHFYDGRNWTYNSAVALSKLFPFWSPSQIKRIIKKLEENGAIYVGNYNERTFDKTGWYALTEEVTAILRGTKSSHDGTESSHGRDEIVPPIPDNKPDIKQHIYTLAQKREAFEKFWNAYPKKRSKGDAEKAFRGIMLTDELFHDILKAVSEQRKSVEWIKESGKFIPYPATWLNAQGWLDECEQASSGGLLKKGIEKRIAEAQHEQS